MAKKVTVSCPHCGSTGTYTVGFESGPGESPAKCSNCKKTFWIHINKGQVDRVKK
jgi:transposase-like protein